MLPPHHHKQAMHKHSQDFSSLLLIKPDTLPYPPLCCLDKYKELSIRTINKPPSGFPGGSDGEEFACNVGDLGSIPGSGRSPGGVMATQLQCSCLGNSMNWGAWQVRGYSLWGCRVRHDWETDTFTFNTPSGACWHFISFGCCCSVTQSCPTLCNPMDGSKPGLPVPHNLPEFAQVHAHCIGDPFRHLILWCPLLLLPWIFPSIRDFSNQVSCSHQMTKILELGLQHYSSKHWLFRVNFP